VPERGEGEVGRGRESDADVQRYVLDVRREEISRKSSSLKHAFGLIRSLRDLDDSTCG
jgi:hypothetical protein